MKIFVLTYLDFACREKNFYSFLFRWKKNKKIILNKKYNYLNTLNSLKKIKYFFNNHKKFIFFIEKIVITEINKYLPNKKSVKFWKIYLRPIIMYLSFSYLIKLKQIRLLKKKYKFLYYKGLKNKNIDSIEEFFAKLNRDDKWNQEMYQFIIDREKNAKIKYCNYKISNTNYKEKNNQLFWTSIINKKNLFLENFYLSKLQKILIHLKFFQIPFYKKINNIIYKKKKDKNLNYIRNAIVNSILNKKIKSDYKNFLIFFFNKIPSVFIESFNDLEKYIKSNESYYIKNPKTILATNYFQNSKLNYYLARETCKKNNLYMFQHGGVYGMSKFNMVEDLEINSSKKFYTYGWEKNKKTIPGFFYKKKISKIATKKIYIMMQNENVYPMQPQVPRGTEDFLSYSENCETFITELDKSVLKNTLVRYPGKLDNIKSYFCKGRLKFDLNKDLSKSLSQAKFVINTVNSTVFLETMYHDIPNILLLDCKKNYYSTISNQILRELVKSKIIHYDPVEASRFVNMLLKENNICGWWSKNEEIINQFKMQFCRQKQTIKWLKKIT